MVLNKTVQIFVCLALASVALAKHDAQGHLWGKASPLNPKSAESCAKFKQSF